MKETELIFGNSQEEKPNNKEDMEKREPQTSDIQGIPPVQENGNIDQEKFNDPNAIKITISDEKTPLVILFGPPSCGKTMTLIRLTRYLQAKGYTVEPVTSFRPPKDENYKEMCKNFNKMINSDDAAKSTANINFMLIRVMKQGKVLCQILEGPGELYFSPKNPTTEYPAYLNTIINSSNRKIWAVMLEPDSTNETMNTEVRKNYVTRIHKLKKIIGIHDKIIFLFNKIDTTEFVLGPGRIMGKSIMKEAKDLYPNIFDPFRNEIPIMKWMKTYNFDFIPFQTGTFTKTATGSVTFQEGKNFFPEMLWQIMLKRIRGGIWV